MNLPNDAVNKIETAIRKLSASADKEEEIRAFALAMAQITQDPVQSRAKLRRAGKDQVERQLKSLSSLAFKLRHELDCLSEQTIQSLWDARPFVMKDGTPVRVNVDQIRSELPFTLEILEHVSKKADTSQLPQSVRGNSINSKVAAITSLSGYHYKRVTGTDPDMSRGAGKFRALLQSIFDVLEIDANVERATKDLIAGP